MEVCSAGISRLPCCYHTDY